MSVETTVWTYWLPDDRVSADEPDEYVVQNIYLVPGEGEPADVFGGLFMSGGKFLGSTGSVHIDLDGVWHVEGEHSEYGSAVHNVEGVNGATEAIEKAEDDHYGFSGESAKFEVRGEPQAFEVYVPDLNDPNLEVRVVGFSKSQDALRDWVLANRSEIGAGKLPVRLVAQATDSV